METFILNYLNENFKKSNLRTCSMTSACTHFEKSSRHLTWIYSKALGYDYELRFVLDGDAIEIKKIKNKDLIKKLLEIFSEDIFERYLSRYFEKEWNKRL